MLLGALYRWHTGWFALSQSRIPGSTGSHLKGWYMYRICDLQQKLILPPHPGQSHSQVFSPPLVYRRWRWGRPEEVGHDWTLLIKMAKVITNWFFISQQLALLTFTEGGPLASFPGPSTGPGNEAREPQFSKSRFKAGASHRKSKLSTLQYPRSISELFNYQRSTMSDLLWEGLETQPAWFPGAYEHRCP